MPTAKTTTAPTQSLKTLLTDAVIKLLDPKAGIIKILRGDNAGPSLAKIFFWQTIKKLSDDQCDKAWEVARLDGLIEADDHYRSLGKGEHIVTESRQFSVVMTVSAGSRKLDEDAFVLALAKRSSLEVREIWLLLEANKVVGKMKLTKRVLEV